MLHLNYISVKLWGGDKNLDTGKTKRLTPVTLAWSLFTSLSLSFFIYKTRRQSLAGRNGGSGAKMHGSGSAQFLAHTRLLRRLHPLPPSFLSCWNPIHSTLLSLSHPASSDFPSRVWSLPLLQAMDLQYHPLKPHITELLFSPKKLIC